jgi:sugar phosphate isomerase/epimerase
MQLGIFAKTFAGSDPETVLAAAKAAGFTTVQYNLACSGLAAMPDDVPDDTIVSLKRAVTSEGITIAALSATYNMIHPFTDERAKGHRRLAVIAKAAAQTGIPLLTLCTGTRNPDDQWSHHPQNTTRGAWRDLLHSMEIAITLAEQHDFALGIEPELANVVNSAAKAKQLIDELQSPRVKIVFDPANLFERESIVDQRRIISEGLDLLAPHIAMAHAKDRTAEGDFTTAGQGVLDYPHFLRELTKCGFRGPIITHSLSAAEAPAVSAFLRTQLKP